MLRHAAALIVVAASAAAQGLGERIDSILASGGASRALWGIHVVDVETGKSLFDRNAALPMTPASNMKLLTTALALLTFGAQHRFETRVLLAPSGDLVLVGGADPSLSGRIYPYVRDATGDPKEPLAALAGQVKAAGVTKVEGDLVGDDTLHEHDPWPGGWAVDDLPWEYGAPVGALAYNDNAASLTIRPGAQAGDMARVTLSPALAWFTIHNTLRTERGARRQVRLDRMPGSSVLTIAGVAPPGAGASTQSIAVDDPARFAAEAFREALSEAGIPVMGRVRVLHRQPGEAWTEPRGRTVARRLSPPLSEIVAVINKVSQNLHAELMLREIGRAKGGRAARSAGVEQLASWLAGLVPDTRELALVDGSGLSRQALASPRVLTAVLRAMAASAEGEVFSQSLPAAGVDGTLSARFRGLGDASAIRAKTGSVRHVAALSGYATQKTGRLAFSIVANHATAPAQEIRAAIDRIGMAILESSRD